jgi:hypothetical protein
VKARKQAGRVASDVKLHPDQMSLQPSGVASIKSVEIANNSRLVYKALLFDKEKASVKSNSFIVNSEVKPLQM